MSFYCFVNWALCSSTPAAQWHKTVPNPDLEIRGGGDPVIQRPLDKGGSPKSFFQPFRPKFGLKIRVGGGGGVGMGPFPRSTTAKAQLGFRS